VLAQLLRHPSRFSLFALELQCAARDHLPRPVRPDEPNACMWQPARVVVESWIPDRRPHGPRASFEARIFRQWDRVSLGGTAGRWDVTSVTRFRRRSPCWPGSRRSARRRW
jgi:hypothetical protein